MHVKVYEDNDMHNGKWTSAEWDECGIYRRKQSGKRVADDHRVLVFTTQKNQMKQKQEL